MEVVGFEEVEAGVKVFNETLLLERAMVKSQLGDQLQYNDGAYHF
jgi:hypothetical protein